MTTVQGLPIGFADQVLELEIRLEQEQSLEIIQILSQMYRIAVEFYIENDIKRANYFQKKLNNLVVKSLNANSVSDLKQKKSELPNRIRKQINHYQQCGKTYIQSMVQNSEKTERKLRRKLEDDLNKQEEKLKGRMLKRVKSTQKMIHN